MKTRRFFPLLVIGGLLSAAAAAAPQDDPAAEPERREAGEQSRAAGAEALSIEEEMRAAEARLEAAARRIAELSTRQLPDLFRGEWAFAFGGRPLLGITIDGETDDGPVEGVEVRGVTPGGAASEAGLRAGDVLTSINDESLAADSSAAAIRRLLEFMDGMEEGDRLSIGYLRDGRVGSAELEPRPGPSRSFGFGVAPGAPAPPHAPLAHGMHELLLHRDAGWRDMEMVPLSEDLGRYFGTDKGLLVVRAPADGALKLEDGDVIQAIGGREPGSIGHAVRILASYQPGETLELEIMRDKRRRKLEVEIPDDWQSRDSSGTLPGAVAALRRHAERR